MQNVFVQITKKLFAEGRLEEGVWAIKSTSKWLLVNIQGDFAGQGKQFSNVIFRQLQAVIITWVIGIRYPENTFSRYFFTIPQHANSCLAPRFSLITQCFYRNPVPSLACPLSLLLYDDYVLNWIKRTTFDLSCNTWRRYSRILRAIKNVLQSF